MAVTSLVSPVAAASESSTCSKSSLTPSRSTSSPAGISGTRSSMRVIRRPLLRKAYCWNRERSVSQSYWTESKILSSAQKVTVVPVASVSSIFRRGPVATPWSKDIRKAWPFWRTQTSRRVERALTTEEPTPWRPPETL